MHGTSMPCAIRDQWHLDIFSRKRVYFALLLGVRALGCRDKIVLGVLGPCKSSSKEVDTIMPSSRRSERGTLMEARRLHHTLCSRRNRWNPH